MRQSKPPVFCDHCPLLALGLLDGAPVCAECLATALAREGALALVGRVEPLRLKKPYWWRSWCQTSVVGALKPSLERTGQGARRKSCTRPSWFRSMGRTEPSARSLTPKS